MKKSIISKLRSIFRLVFCSFVKRAMARKHHSRGGQQKQLKGNEGATRIHGKAYAFRRNIAMREDEICLI